MRREQKYQARATTLNPRELPFMYFGREYPPGEWQSIGEREAEVFRYLPHMEIREGS